MCHQPHIRRLPPSSAVPFRRHASDLRCLWCSNAISILHTAAEAYATSFTEDTVLLAPPNQHLQHRQKLAIQLRRQEKSVLRNNAALLRWRWASFLANPDRPFAESLQAPDNPSPIEAKVILDSRNSKIARDKKSGLHTSNVDATAISSIELVSESAKSSTRTQQQDQVNASVEDATTSTSVVEDLVLRPIPSFEEDPFWSIPISPSAKVHSSLPYRDKTQPCMVWRIC
jgi:hypothetical protein